MPKRGKLHHTFRPTEKVRHFKRAGLSLQGWGHFSRSLTTLADRKSGPVTKHTETHIRTGFSNSSSSGLLSLPHSLACTWSPWGNFPWSFQGTQTLRTVSDSRANRSVTPQAMSTGEEKRQVYILWPWVYWMRWLDGITNSIDMNSNKLRDTVKDMEAWRAAVHGIEKSQPRPSNWTTMQEMQETQFRSLGQEESLE